MIEKPSHKYVPAELLAEITKRINLHHTLYKNLTIKDKYWEYILVESYRTVGHTVNYDPDNHVPGKDLTVKNLFNDNRDVNISCKSGKVFYSKRLKKIVNLNISSYRTTKYNTLEEKLNYIDGGHEDVVLSLSSTLFNKEKKYILTAFVPPKFKNMVWKQTKGGYQAEEKDFNARILRQCSDQLWYTLQYDSPYVLESYDVCTN